MCKSSIANPETEVNITALLSPKQQENRDLLIKALLDGMAVVGREGSFFLVARPGDPRVHRVWRWFNGHEHTRYESCDCRDAATPETETYYMPGGVSNNGIAPCPCMVVCRFHLLDDDTRAALLAHDPALAAAYQIQQKGGCVPPTPAGYRPCAGCSTPTRLRVLPGGLPHLCGTCQAARNAATRARHSAIASSISANPAILSSVPGEIGAAA